MKLRLAFSVLLFLSLSYKGTAQSKTLAAGQPVQDAFSAWNAHDPDKVAAFYADNIVYEDVTYGMVARGHAEMRKLAANFFAAVPDLKLEIVKSTRDKNSGSIEWVFSGTDAGLYKTGKKFSVRGVSLFEIHGGKFSANRDYYDSATIMRQVGLLPAATPSSK